MVLQMSLFEQIIGYTDIKNELIQIADTLKNPEAYAALGAKTPRGLLLHGNPGVGKTLMAKAVIEESGRKVFTCRKNKPDGDFIKQITNTFDKASEHAPSIVFLDDMDKFANADEEHRDAEEYVTIQSCIDSIKDKEVFVIATVNNMRNLPSSLKRAGRFDRVIRIGNPKGADAIKIVEHYLEEKKLTDNIDTTLIARLLNGESCATLETIINEAALLAGYEKCEKIEMSHFIKAIMRVVYEVEAIDEKPLALDKLKALDTFLAKVVYHEAGHAVVAEVLNPNSVVLISTTRSGPTAGFVVDRTLEGEEVDHSFDYYQKHLITSLAGKAAVEYKTGKVELGCLSDISGACRTLSNLIEDEGAFGFNNLNSDFASNYHKQAVELTIANELDKYYYKAKQVIIANIDFFEKIASELATKRTLLYDDVQRIKADCQITPISI